MARVTSGTRSPLKIVVIVVAVMVILLFISAVHQINEASKGYSYGYEERDYIYAAEYGRYDDLYETALNGMDKDIEISAEVAEYRALAFYYEQAVLEHAYRVAGDTAKADEFAARMAEYEAQLGSMASKAADARAAVAG